MKALATVCTLGLAALVSSGASAQTGHEHPDVVIDGGRVRPARHITRADSAQVAQPDGISTTAANQLVVELAPDDTAPANLFDLDARTLIFTPDGHGGYSRSVQSVAWEDNIGRAVADGAEIQLESFMFDFAARRWGSFFVSRHGLITFGEPLTYSYWDSENRFDTMPEIASNLVTTPTISPLYKPMLGGRSDQYGAMQHVASSPEQVVVTWITTEPDYYVHGVPPATPSRFQVILSADGGIAFNYADVTIGDGIVGVFSNEGVTKGDLITSIPDGRDIDLPAHLDLLDASIYESNTYEAIVEFTTRGPMPDPSEGTWYSYRVHVDVDPPFFTDDGDLDFVWQIDVRPGGDVRARGGRLLAIEADNRMALLVDIEDVAGSAGMVRAGTAEFYADGSVRGDGSGDRHLSLPVAPTRVDLSWADRNFSSRQSEVFHYRRVPDLNTIACRVIGVLGDEFDLFVFHNEFRVDSQESATPWTRYGGNVNVKGVGDVGRATAPCGEGRLKGRWVLPVWMKSDHVVNHNSHHDERTRFDRGLLLFAHEFTHAWTAHASHERNGEREPLFGQYCQCHWRPDLHVPAAFPWHEDEAGPRSLMGGRYWRDNGDGTFTPLDGYWGGGHSWLDLYMMGVADASEVPDIFILRNLKPVREGDQYGPHTGEKEWVSIAQVVAAEGPREPAAADAQSVFNAAFVYLVEPGQTPDDDMLRLHAEYRDKVIEHWYHITGGRSQITTTVASLSNGSPVTVGTLSDP